MYVRGEFIGEHEQATKHYLVSQKGICDVELSVAHAMVSATGGQLKSTVQWVLIYP